MRADCSPENIRRSLDFIIGQLGGKKLDVFECARRDLTVPLQTALSVLDKEHVQTGKLGGIYLSEVSAATIHEAVKFAKIVAVEVEISLFSTDILTNGVTDVCALHGIPLVAYSPLGRGVLTGQIKSIDDEPASAIRHHLPRFQPGNFEINLQLVEQVKRMASKKGCTPAQLALGWVVSLQRRPGMPTIIPIPGGTTVDKVVENFKIIRLTDDEMEEIDATLAKFEVAGGRFITKLAQGYQTEPILGQKLDLRQKLVKVDLGKQAAE